MIKCYKCGCHISDEDECLEEGNKVFCSKCVENYKPSKEKLLTDIAIEAENIVENIPKHKKLRKSLSSYYDAYGSFDEEDEVEVKTNRSNYEGKHKT